MGPVSSDEYSPGHLDRSGEINGGCSVPVQLDLLPLLGGQSRVELS